MSGVSQVSVTIKMCVEQSASSISTSCRWARSELTFTHEILTKDESHGETSDGVLRGNSQTILFKSCSVAIKSSSTPPSFRTNTLPFRAQTRLKPAPLAAVLAFFKSLYVDEGRNSLT